MNIFECSPFCDAFIDHALVKFLSEKSAVLHYHKICKTELEN